MTWVPLGPSTVASRLSPTTCGESTTPAAEKTSRAAAAGWAAAVTPAVQHARSSRTTSHGLGRGRPVGPELATRRPLVSQNA